MPTGWLSRQVSEASSGRQENMDRLPGQMPAAGPTSLAQDGSAGEQR